MLERVLDASQLLELSVGHLEISHQIPVDVVLARSYVVRARQLVLTQPVLEVLDLAAELCVLHVAAVFAHRFQLLLFFPVFLDSFTEHSNDLEQVSIALHLALQVLQRYPINLFQHGQHPKLL